jgi:hypothetical protein
MISRMRWIGALSFATGSILLGCSRSPAPAAQEKVVPQPEVVSIADEKDAIRRFQATRSAAGFPTDPEERLRARRDTLKNCLAQVKSSLQPREMKNCIVFGELSALDQEGACWVVEVDQGLLGGQIAYFDDMGRLVFAWRAPEG